MNAPVLLFPGQGAQEPGMGRDLAESVPDAAYIWKQAEQASGLPLRGVYWEGDEASMADTRFLQPALAAMELALWQALAPKLKPAACAGHSLGEFCALAAAGVLPPGDVLELVSLRGRLMAEADPDGRGAMCAVVKMEQADVEALVREIREQSGAELRIANYNTPAQFVLSGAAGVMDAVTALVKERRGRALPLKVSGAFHSPFMADAAEEFGRALRRRTWNKPRFPVYCNALGRAVTSGEDAKEAALVQMTSSVLWIQTIQAQRRAGADFWLELGPKPVLSKMLGPILAALPAGEQGEFRAENICTFEQLQGVVAGL